MEASLPGLFCRIDGRVELRTRDVLHVRRKACAPCHRARTGPPSGLRGKIRVNRQVAPASCRRIRVTKRGPRQRSAVSLQMSNGGERQSRQLPAGRPST
jgi:hypothetical protein